MTLRITWENYRKPLDVDLEQVYTLSVIPKSVTVNINDITQADTFTAEFEYKSFPFDPRSIRSVGVTIHMEDMKTLVEPISGALKRIAPKDGTNFALGPSNTVFQGFADEDSIEFDESRRIVRLEGRDFTSLLIDQPFQKRSVNMFQPLNVILQGLLSELESTRELRVENKTEETLPNIGKFAPSYTPLGGTRSKRKNESYWDVIQDLIGRAGLIAYVELDKLVLNNPRTLFNKDKPKQFVYGKNIKSFKLKRELGKTKGVNVRIRALDVEKKQVLNADIPREASLAFLLRNNLKAEDVTIEKLNTKGEKVVEKAPFITQRVANITDKDHLISVGEQVYEEIGRQEIAGSLVTREMLLCEEPGGVEFDITKLRNGTPISIEIDHEDLTGMLRFENKAQRVNYLLSKCYPAIIANALAKSSGKFAKAFFTRSIKFDYSIDNGFKVDIDFINFIELDESILS